MLRKFTFLAVLTLLSTAFGSSYLAAQSQSMTSSATQGLYTTDVDKYLGVNEWQDVVVNKALAFLKASAADGVGAGTAFKAGPVFLGIGYDGKFWSGTASSSETDYGSNASSPSAGNTLVNSATDSGLAWSNRISALIGTGLLGGILVDVDIAGAGSDNDDFDTADSGNNIRVV
jgi:hypothetical protein